MQIRKLVKSGLSSFVVALPKDFIEKNKLQKGDLIYIEQNSKNELTITTEFNERSLDKKTKVIECDNVPFSTVKRELTSAYLDNYYEIIIRGKEIPKHIKEIKSEIAEKVALEVVDESSEKIVARDFLNYKDTEIIKLIRRIDNIVRSMLIDMKQAINNKEVFEMIYERDDEVNKLGFLVYRVVKTACINPEIAKTLGIKTLDIVALWDVNMHLEKMGDESKRVARILSNLDTKKVNPKKIISIIDLMEEKYKSTLESFHTKNIALADKVYNERKAIFKQLDDFASKNKDSDVVEIIGKFKGMMSHLIDITRLVRYA